MFEILTPSDWRKGNLIVEKRQMLIGICWLISERNGVRACSNVTYENFMKLGQKEDKNMIRQNMIKYDIYDMRKVFFKSAVF